jgi:hypothetical protein
MLKIDQLVDYLENVTVKDDNILDVGLTIPERDLIIDALILYKEMN